MIAVLLTKKIISLFIIVAIGAIMVRTTLIKASESKILSVLMVYVFNPATIFNAFLVDYSDEIRDGLLLAFLAAILVHILVLILGKVLQIVFKLDDVEKGSAMYSNAGNLIIPIVYTVLGPEWVIYTSAFMSVQLMLMWTHGRILMSGEKKIDVKKIVTNSNLIAVVLGMIFFFGRIPLPFILADTVSSMAVLIGPCAMLVTGMLIGSMTLKELTAYKRVWIVALIRLLIIPLCSLVLLKFSGLANLVPDGRQILLITFLANMTPAASTITLMAQLFDRDAHYASVISVITTIFCVVTMPILVFLYQL